MPISVVFDPPLPSDSPSTFNTKAFTLLGDLNDWSTQANALPGEVATNLSALLAAPPAIGSTTPAAGSFTTLSASGITKVNSATNSGNTMLGVKVATDAQLWVRPGTELGGSAGVGIQSSNDAGSGSTALTLYGSSIKLDGGAVTIPGSLSTGTLSASSSNGVTILESPGISSVGLQFRTNSSNRFKLETPSGSADLVAYSAGTTEVARFTSSGLAVTGTLSASGAATMSGTLNVKSTAFGLAGFGAGSGYAATDTTVRLVSYFGSSDAPAPGVSPSGLYISYTGAASIANRRTDLNTYTYGSGAQGVIGLNNGAVVIDNAGAVTFNSGTFGYGTGAGGTVTQATSKSTAVTLNKSCGQIVMNNAALGAGATVIFQCANSTVGVASVIEANVSWGLIDPANYSVRASSYSSAPGTIYFVVKNESAGSLSEAVVINFQVHSGATS